MDTLEFCGDIFQPGGNLRLLLLFRLRCSKNVGNLNLMPIHMFPRLWEEFCEKILSYIKNSKGGRVLKPISYFNVYASLEFLADPTGSGVRSRSSPVHLSECLSVCLWTVN